MVNNTGRNVVIVVLVVLFIGILFLAFGTQQSFIAGGGQGRSVTSEISEQTEFYVYFSKVTGIRPDTSVVGENNVRFTFRINPTVVSESSLPLPTDAQYNTIFIPESVIINGANVENLKVESQLLKRKSGESGGIWSEYSGIMETVPSVMGAEVEVRIYKVGFSPQIIDIEEQGIIDEETGVVIEEEIIILEDIGQDVQDSEQGAVVSEETEDRSNIVPILIGLLIVVIIIVLIFVVIKLSKK